MKRSTLKAKIHMLNIGIVPAMTGKELSDMLNSLPKEDRRKVKRKFRKEWRKLVKRNPELKDILYPEKSTKPTRSQLRSRSVYLVSNIMKNVD